MDSTIAKKVINSVNKISGNGGFDINPDGDLKKELPLDSFQIVELFAMLEKEFDVELPLQMMNAKTGKEFMVMLEESIAKKEIVRCV
jgi:acyl carrier protein